MYYVPMTTTVPPATVTTMIDRKLSDGAQCTMRYLKVYQPIYKWFYLFWLSNIIILYTQRLTVVTQFETFLSNSVVIMILIISNNENVINLLFKNNLPEVPNVAFLKLRIYHNIMKLKIMTC